MALNKDVLAGLIFVAAGSTFGLYALLHLEFGSIYRMGPGFFPAVLSCALAGIGLVGAVRGVRSGQVVIGNRIPWRAIMLLTLSPVLFGLTVRSFGLIPATALCVLSASFASRTITPKRAMILTVSLTAFCVIFFVFVLGQPMMLIRTDW